MATPPAHNLAPVPPIEPGRHEGVHVVTPEDDARALQEAVESGLLSTSESSRFKIMESATRGAGRGEDRA